MRYIFDDKYSFLHNNIETPGINFFSGSYVNLTSGNSGIAFLKTTWGDDIFFYKKYFSPGLLLYSSFSFNALQQTYICSGIKGTSYNAELLLTKVDTAGIIMWANSYKLSLGHLGFKTGFGEDVKNILVTQQAIYLNGIFNTDFATICKFDLDGNLIWCRSFNTAAGATRSFDAPILKNGKLIFEVYKNDGAPTYKQYSVITILDEQSGSLIESYSLKSIANSKFDGIIPSYLHLNSNGTFTLIGHPTIGTLSLIHI